VRELLQPLGVEEVDTVWISRGPADGPKFYRRKQDVLQTNAKAPNSSGIRLGCAVKLAGQGLGLEGIALIIGEFQRRPA
jgi:hypothetical protein